MGPSCQGDQQGRSHGSGGMAKHKLWQVTQDFLQEQKRPAAEDADRFFVTEDGNPLVVRELVDGKFAQSDAIKCSFWRIQRKTGINSGRGFYSLRKTGATLIEAIDPLVTEMYLAHAEPGQKRAYYGSARLIVSPYSTVVGQKPKLGVSRGFLRIGTKTSAAMLRSARLGTA